MIGRTLGHYEVVAKVGAGGMGDVYRARDTKLNRDVALKVLPDEFARDPERLARFQREAHVLASLNHPNIAHIHGLEEDNGVRALVMELVEGDDLAARIRRGPMAPAEALAIAQQVALALDTAHEHGIIHRDLKPANIKVRPDGAVKVLDFGLAKTAAPDDTDAVSARQSLTTSPAMTQQGFILGTAAYMSPEQARGRPVDKRTDIWAFGVVFFEMLTGRPLFAGETVTDVLAGVVTRDPDWSSLPAGTPPAVRELLRHCLEKDRTRRLRDIGDARLLLEAAAPAAAPPAPLKSARGLVWAIAALALLLLTAIAYVVTLTSGTKPAAITRFDIGLPTGAFLRLDEQPAIGISPDGQTVAFVASENGVRRIFLRRRGDVDAHALPGSEEGADPVFSPDGKSIAFATHAEVRKASLDGISSTITASFNPRGLAWLDNDTIVFAPEPRAGLVTVAASGGVSKPLTKVDQDRNERSHRWPEVLPGGKAVLFTIGDMPSPDSYDRSKVGVVVVASGERHTIDLPDGAAFVRYSKGYLVFGRGGSIYAVRFDLDRLQTVGTPVVVLQGVSVDVNTGATHFAIASDGTLVYVPGNPTPNLRRLVWVNRSGAVEPIDAPPAVFNDPRISPDGSRVALLVGPIGSGDIWVYGLKDTTRTRLTFDGLSVSPIWSPDGRSVYYANVDASKRKTTFERRAADGSREPEPVGGAIDLRAYLSGLERSEHGGIIFQGPWGGFFDVARASFGPKTTTADIVATPANEYGPALSPDEKWVAYTSPESGRNEVYVLGLSGARRRIPISTDGGEEAHWSPTGREILYRAEDRLMAVTVQSGEDLAPGKPVVLFRGVYNLQSETGFSFDIDPRSGRFLMIRLADDHANAPITSVRVALNWLDEAGKVVSEKGK